jgi:hypothetical protein
MMSGTYADRFDTLLEIKKNYTMIYDSGITKVQNYYKFKHKISGEEFKVEHRNLKSFLEMTKRDEKLKQLGI